MQDNPQHHTEMQEVSLHDYINVLFLYRKTFAWAFLSVFLGTALYTFFMTPVYEANATMHVKDERSQSGRLEELLMNRQSPIETELEILKSRTNMENVVRKLHLDWHISDESKGLSVRILDFSSTSPDPSYTVRLTGPGSFTVLDSKNANVGQGKTGELMQGQGVSLFIAEITGSKGDSFRLEKGNFDDTAASLGKAVKAVELGRKTNIISVSYRDNDPRKATAVINTLTTVYMEQNRGYKTQGATETVKFLDEQLGNLRIDLNDSEKNLEKYKVSTGMMELDAEAKEIITKLSEIEKERKEVTLRKKQAEFALDNLNEAIQKKVIYSPALLYSPGLLNNDTLMAGMAAKLSELEVQKNALLSEYHQAHPAVRQVQAQIDDLQRKIHATYENEFKNLTKSEANLGQVINQYETQMRKLPVMERQQASLLRSTRVNQEVYAFLLQKREESRIAAASTLGAVDIIDPAIVPKRPVKPVKRKNLLLGLLVGCMVGVGAAFLRNSLDDTIKDVETARRVLGLPLLSQIPHIGGTEDQGKENALIVQKEPKAPASEAFRSLRTAIHFSAVTSQKQVLLVTSTFPGEGKSTIIANLSITMAQTGARVLLMDCDLRRPSLHEIFAHSKVPGLSEILVGDVEFEKTIHNTGIPGLDFVSAGTTPPNPSELLGSPQMSKLLETLKERYAYILLDAPPVLAVTDAPLLAASVNMVIVVMEAGRVPVKAAQQVRDLLAGIGRPAAGLVFNNKTSRSELYGYGYGYSSKYGYYGEQKEEQGGKPWWKLLGKK
jgi:tyrosine-protein kinase Etk/Wzc